MKNNFLVNFVQTAKNNNKTAFICGEGNSVHSVRKITFDDFLNDIFKMNDYLSHQLEGNNVLIFSYPYSYLFFVGIFSCVFLGKKIVIIDSFSDRKKTSSMMEMAQITDVLTDKITGKLSFLLPGKNHKIPLKNFADYKPVELVKDCASIVTFTSGTTGIPKIITRELDFLESQIELIKNNMEIHEGDVTYGLLPMYTLLSVLMNNTCLVSKKIDDCSKFAVTMLLAPIKKIKKIKKPLKTVERTFLGGAILYHKETEEILSKLPNSKITYVYGASEGAVIYKTELSRYGDSPFTFDEKSAGIDVTIDNPDKNGIGEIIISGKTVIGQNHTHNTGDYGKICDGKLILLGRKKYSCSSIGFYNYEYDENLRKQNPKIKAAFSFYYDNQIHVAYTGKIKREPDVIYHHFVKLPYDLKHKTKLDYGKILEKINTW